MIYTDSINYDVCDLNLIYNKETGYEYSLPKRDLESYLSGKAFDHPHEYLADESERLHEDIYELFYTIMSSYPIRSNLAIMTAGAPGSGKTTKLRQDLAEQELKNNCSYAYICPDDVCLKKQRRTFQIDIEEGNQSFEARKQAYDKWRPGSNAATHLILANLIRERFTFYFGTTSSSPHTGKFFEFLKKQGYRIRLLHLTAPDDVRWESIKERDKTFVQTTEQDVRAKGLLVPQRIEDAYLGYADEIEFYYRGGVKENALLAARWLRYKKDSEYIGALQIYNQELYGKIKEIHNTAIQAINKPELAWEKSVEKVSEIFSLANN